MKLHKYSIICLLVLILMVVMAGPAFAELGIVFNTNGAAGDYGPGSELMLLGKVTDNGITIRNAEVTVTIQTASGTQIHFAKPVTDDQGFFRTRISVPVYADGPLALSFRVGDKTIDSQIAFGGRQYIDVLGFIDCSGYKEGEQPVTIPVSTSKFGLLFGGNVNYYNNRYTAGDLTESGSLGVNERNRDCFTLYKLDTGGSYVNIGCSIDLVESRTTGGDDQIGLERIHLLPGQSIPGGNQGGGRAVRNAIFVMPDEALIANTIYKLVIDGRLSGNSSATLGADETFYFRTAGGASSLISEEGRAAGAAAGSVPNVATGSVMQASSASGKAMVLAQSDAISALDATGLVIASIAEKPADAGMLAQWRSIDPVNTQLADTIYTVELTNDGKKTEDAYQLFNLVIDLSAVNLTASQKSMLTGVYFDAVSGTYKNLGGELSADGKSFSFYSSYAGDHSLIVSDTLIKAEFSIGSKEYKINGKVQSNDVAPIIREGRTLMPVRVLAESLGAEVVWEAKTRTVSLYKDGKSVSVVIGQPLPDDMGTAIILNDRTYLPLRYIGQMLDCNIVWKAETQTVIAFS